MRTKHLLLFEVPTMDEIQNESPPTGTEPLKSSPKILIDECEQQPAASVEKSLSTAIEHIV